MLSTNERSLVTSVLAPPPGMVLDRGLATTFSLDPAALLQVPLHLALLGRGEEGLRDPLRLLESLRRVSDRLVVFADRGRLLVPGQRHVLYGLLEPMIVEVRAPGKGAFHPKLWLLRFVEPDAPDAPLLRLVVSSRNLTFDRSWDTVLQLEGRPTGAYVGDNRELGELLRDLPGLAVEAVPPSRAELARTLADEMRRTRFEPPPEFESVRFHVLGRSRRRWLPERSTALVVVSPFVTDDAVAALADTSGEPLALVTRPESLDALSPHARSRFAQRLVLDDAAEAEDGVETEDRDTLGLHAKIYAARRGWRTHLYLGSANATSAALLAGANVEVLAELVGLRSRVRDAADLLGPDGLGGLLVAHDDAAGPPPPDAGAEALNLLEAVRGAIAAAPLRLDCRAAGEDWRLILRSEAPLSLPPAVTLRAWPVSVVPEQGADATSLPDGPVELGGFGTASVTGLLAFEAALGDARLRFVLNVPVAGLPESRDAAIVRTVVRNRDGFLRYLLLLLGDVAAGAVDVDGEGSGGGRGSFGAAFVDDLPLIEGLVRSLAREPERLRDVARLVERLGGDGSVVPPEFLELWAVFAAALETSR